MRCVLAMTTIASTALLATVATTVSPRLIWNASASVPIGLYAVRSIHQPRVGDLVLVEPPNALAAYLAQRGYLPDGVPMLKRIAALHGQIVCRRRSIVTVDGLAQATARERDSRGRVLPAWAGCRSITYAEVFLLNRDAPDSLDGRYFGPLPLRSLRGRAVPLWTRGER